MQSGHSTAGGGEYKQSAPVLIDVISVDQRETGVSHHQRETGVSLLVCLKGSSGISLREVAGVAEVKF